MCAIKEKKQYTRKNEGAFVKQANAFAFFTIAAFAITRGIESAVLGQPSRAWFIGSSAVAAEALYIILSLSLKDTRRLALWGPLSLMIIYTIGSTLFGDFRHYFIVYMPICAIAALYLAQRSLLAFIALSQLIIVGIFASGAITRANTHPAAFYDALTYWVMAFLGSILIYMISNFASRSAKSAVDAYDSFASLLAATPNMTVLLDEKNRVKFMSKPLLFFLGIHSWRAPLGRPVFDLFEPELRVLLAAVLSVKERDYSKTEEFTLRGQTRHVKIVTGWLRGNTKGRFIDITDISATVEAKLKAEASNKAKSAFLATVSHEIRTPLNAIIGLSEIEIEKPLERETAANIEKIYSGGRTLLTIVNDMLDISKIEAGAMEILPVEYDTPSLINDAVQLNIVRIGSKPVTFTLAIDEALPQYLYGDDLRVKQILNNLLSNAIKYTGAGTVTLEARWNAAGAEAAPPAGVRALAENEGVLTFIVRDSGKGIKSEDIDRLFTEYGQADTRANRAIEGTGLGLVITRNLARLLGGVIQVESEYGKGSVFTVHLAQGTVGSPPIGKETAQKLASFRFTEVSLRRQTGIPPKAMPGRRALVVDDVQTNLDVARGLLLRYKLQIDTALSGREALEKMARFDTRYDIIFMDHMMPEMDGVETARVIRTRMGAKEGEYAGIPDEAARYAAAVPIVALTANALSGAEEAFLAAGFNGFISKPIDLLRLDQTLRQFIPASDSSEESADTEGGGGPAATESGGAGEAAAGEDEASKDAPLPPIKGVRYEEALRRFGGAALYREIAASFIESAPPLLEEARRCVSGDLAGGGHLADCAVHIHGIKGAAYTIGAFEVGDRAKELEAAAKAGNAAFVAEEMASFTALVEALLADLRAARFA